MLPTCGLGHEFGRSQPDHADFAHQHFTKVKVSLIATAACVLDELGRIVKEAEVAREPDPISHVAGERDLLIAAVCRGSRAIVAAVASRADRGGAGRGSHGHRPVKVAVAALPIGTDRCDAEGVTHLIHLGRFGPVHDKSASYQEVRAC
jgi:hypothetical protein